MCTLLSWLHHSLVPTVELCGLGRVVERGRQVVIIVHMLPWLVLVVQHGLVAFRVSQYVRVQSCIKVPLLDDAAARAQDRFSDRIVICPVWDGLDIVWKQRGAPMDEFRKFVDFGEQAAVD